MTPEQQGLMLRAARNLLDHAAAGRHCDPHTLAWARQLLASNGPHFSQGEKMVRDQAHEVLDAAKAGLPVSEGAITTALRATGDLRRNPLRRHALHRPAKPTQLGGGA